MRQNRRNIAQLRLLNRYQRAADVANLRMDRAKARGSLVERFTWFKLPAAPKPREVFAQRYMPKLTTFEAAQLQVKTALAATPDDMKAMADLVLNRPTLSLNHRTVRIAGKPYHWRQDYTGQLKLAGGESPWLTK